MGVIKLCECGCGEPAPLAQWTNVAKGHVKGQPMRFVRGHVRRVYARQDNPSERFWAKVDKTDDCWLWSAALHQGYGHFSQMRDGERLRMPAHRWAYIETNGPISDDLVIDHLCHTRDESCPGGATCPHRACVNPAHLEPVTPRENLDRGRRSPLAPTCIHGHPKTPENTYVYKGKRGCRTCRRKQQRQGGRAA